MIVKKYKRSLKEQEASQEYFYELQQQIAPEDITKWKIEIEQVEENRQHDLASMDIMRNRIPKRKLIVIQIVLFHHETVAPGKKAMELFLANDELHQPDQARQAEWISSGIRIVEDQYVSIVAGTTN